MSLGDGVRLPSRSKSFRRATYSSKLRFLGTGAGTFAISRQNRATGGLLVELDGTTFHIDPGPGASVRAREYGFDLGRVQAILVSHSHVDHMNDVPVLIAAITRGYERRAGCLVASEQTLNDLRKSILLRTYLGTLRRLVGLKLGEQTLVGRVKIVATEAHHCKGSIGFVLKGSKQISYVSDTKYFPELCRWHAGSQVMIMNVVKPDNVDAPNQMNTEAAAHLISEVRPNIAIISHFGRRIRRPEAQAQWLRRKTGIPVHAASDGLTLKI